MLGSWSRTTKWLVSLSAAGVLLVVIVLAVVLQRPAARSHNRGAISTDAAPCHQVGEELLRAGGNAVDVTIGILFCEGVSSAQSMGLGGGFLMTIYDRKKKQSYVLNARETAPASADRDMFGNNTNDESVYGPLGIAIPAELAGYHAAYERFGKLPWATIVEPTVKLCEEGVLVINYVANILQSKKERILQSKSLSALLTDSTGEMKKAGDLIKRTKLAETLRVIAKEGGRALHNGSLTDAFVADLKEFGSIVTADDLRNYRPRWVQPTEAELPHGYRLISTPPPGSGPLLAHFLMLTADLVKAPLDKLQYHRIVEAMKFVYAARTELGDQDMVPAAKVKAAQLLNATFAAEIRKKISDTHTSTDPKFYGANWAAAEPKGTAHVSVITEDLAVSVTSTVNTEYGCMLVGPRTGIIFNNEMDDFSLPGVSNNYGVPPSENNFIAPGKRPQSSMSPSVILDSNGDVRMVIGASGGTRITSSAGLVTLFHLYLGMDLDEAIAEKRLHHQLAPMDIQFELGFPEKLRTEITSTYGHTWRNLSLTASSVMAISVQGDLYYPSADARREGVTALV